MNISETIKEWKESFLSPEDSMPKLVEKANLKDGIKNVILAHLLFYLVFNILAVIIAFLGVGGANINEILNNPFSILSNIIYSIIAFFIGIGIIWIFVRLLGGSGSYDTHLYLLSSSLPFTLILLAFIVNILSLSSYVVIKDIYYPPLRDFLLYITPVSIAISSLIYFTSVLFAIKEINKFSEQKAFLSVVAPFLIFFIVSLFISSAFYYIYYFFPFSFLITSLDSINIDFLSLLHSF